MSTAAQVESLVRSGLIDIREIASIVHPPSDLDVDEALERLSLAKTYTDLGVLRSWGNLIATVNHMVYLVAPGDVATAAQREAFRIAQQRTKEKILAYSIRYEQMRFIFEEAA